MRIRKIKETRNEYVFAGNVWVRNPFKVDAQPLLEDNLFSNEDSNIIIHNDRSNNTNNLGYISDRTFQFTNIAIISDGYEFDNRHKILASIPKNVCIISVNKSLKRWNSERSINFYVTNNPYETAIQCIPSSYFPTCICSKRTNMDFVREYRGIKYMYEPTPHRGFGYQKSQKYFIDDYRNPISAALSLSIRFGVRKIAMICCDDSFTQEKTGAQKLVNGLYTYPQHIRSQEILDAQCFWLNRHGIKVGNYSSGIEYSNAVYIKDDDELKSFFNED